MLKTRWSQNNIFQQIFLSGVQLILLTAGVTLQIEHRISPERVTQFFYILLVLTLVKLTFLQRLRHTQQQERLDSAWKETRLLKEQNRYQSLIELLPQTVFEIETNGNILYSNQQGFKVTGYTQEDLARGLNVFQLLAREDHERARRNLGKLFQEGSVQVNSYTIQRKDGSRFPVQIHSSPIMQAHRIVGVRGIVIDITERQHTEKELQRHRQHLQELVEERTAEIVQVNEALQQEVLNRLETQKALQASDERFRRAILDAPFPIMIHAEDGEVILISNAWSELTGYRPEDIPTINDWIVKAYGDRQENVRQLLHDLYGINRKIYEGEFGIRTASGQIRIWDFSSAPLGKLADGRRAVISMGIDITGRKQVEKMLREKESAIASSINAIAFANLEGNLTYINSSFLKLWDYDKEEEVLGKSALDFWQEPEKAAGVVAALQHEGSWFGELTAKRKDTSTAIFQLSANMITNEQGKPISMMASFIDITERKRAEEARRESEERYRNLVETSQDLIWSCDKDGRFTYLNPAWERILGYKTDEMLGRAFIDFKPSEIVKRDAETFKKTLQGLEVFDYETIYLAKSGAHKHLAFNARKLRDAKGAVMGTQGTAHDITARKLAEEQIRASLQEKEVLLKEVHHRVKNNLQVIASMLYLQSKTIQDHESRTLFLDSRNRIRSMALVHESLYQTENLARLDIAAYIRRLVVNIFRSYRGSSLGIIPTIKVDDMSLSTDAAIPCGLIINELVSNALKYAFPDRQGEVVIKMMKDAEERVILRISDDGVGFPDDFDERQSSSLGIKLVHSLVDQLDGTIEINSEQGSTFQIEFSEPNYRKRI